MLPVNWDDILLFLITVEAGNYSSAAERLGINRTTISRRVQALERQLGHPLFEQAASGYHLTPAGREVLKAARTMEKAMIHLRDHLEGERHSLRGPLRLAAPVGLGPEFMPEFAAFRNAYPEVALELINAQDSLASISQRKADLGLCLTNHLPEHLHGKRVAHLERAIYASKDYLSRNPTTLDLGQHRWIGWGQELAHSLAARWMNTNLPSDVEIAASVNSWHALREAVLAGLGVGPLWCFLANQDPRLVQIRPPLPELGLNLWLLQHQDLPANDRMRTFIDFILPRLAQRVAAVQKPAK